MRPLAIPFIVTLSLLAAAPAMAQDPDHVFDITDGFGHVARLTSVVNTYDNTSDSAIIGWSWGNCIDDPAIIDIDSVADGATVLTINGGMPPVFNAVSITPGMGWTVGVVINFFGDNPLPPGTGYELFIASYQGLSVGMSEVCYCNTLGSPTVEIAIVDSTGGSIDPTTLSGLIEIGPPPPPFTFKAPGDFVNYAPGDPATFISTVSIEEDPANPGFPSPTAGFSMGLSHGSPQPIDVDVTDLDDSPLIAALGEEPAFFAPALLGNGWTAGVLYDFFAGVTLGFDGPVDVIDATYEATNLSDTEQSFVDLEWVDTLGSPPITNTVVVGADAFDVAFENGQVTLNPFSEPTFVRGDCNGDVIVDIADGIFLLNQLFQNGPPSNCNEACDANDDGMADQSDAVYVFGYRFLDGPEPPAPFPDCGLEPLQDCDSSNCP